MLKKPTIIIYRDRLLLPSETFVRGQVETLQHFIPYYVDSQLVQGLPISKEQTVVINQGGLLGKVSEY